MFNKLKGMLKTKDEKELAKATANFDELMGEVDADQQDLVQFQHEMREEFDEMHHEVDEVTKEVDKVVDKKAA